MKETYAKITQFGIVPVVAIEDVENACPLAEALLAGGLPLIEVTFRTRIAAKVIDILTRTYPELIVGAGTVLTLDTFKAAQDMGAAFSVAPGLNPAIATYAKEGDFLHIPGVATPTDIEAALALGVKKLKFFPAEALGGVKMLKALLGPYSYQEVEFMPTGGIKPHLLVDYLKLPGVGAVGGTWLATAQDIKAQAWASITQRCVDAVKLVQEYKV